MALAAISGIIFAAGCGSSSSTTTTTNPVGFSNSSLTGTYVFSSQGADANGYPLALAGTLVSNGTGGITGGTMDLVDPEITPIPSPSQVAQAITSGSYEVGSDGRGQVSLATSAYGTFVLDFVLTSTSHGLVTEFDGTGGGSGTLDLQTAITSLSQLAGPYAFSLAGSDGSSNLNPFATAGAFTLNSSGIIAAGAGVEDFNDNGTVITNQPLTGTATLGSGTGPGALTTPGFPNDAFDFYPIDATHWKIIETDYNDFLAGDVFTQTGASIPTTTMAFTMSGGTSTTAVANGGFMTMSGTSVSGSQDVNNGGSVLSATFSGNAGAAGSVGGRVVVTVSDFNPANTLVVYPSSGGLLMLETDDSSVTSGAAYAQQAGAALAASQAYGFNLSAFNIVNDYEENDIAQFTTTSTGFSGIVDISDNSGPNGGVAAVSQALGGSYTLDSTATGRGEATTTANGSAFVGFTFYAVTSNQFLLLETDGAQVGAGTFEAQSSSSSAAAAHVAMSLVRPMVRSHAALRHK